MSEIHTQNIGEGTQSDGELEIDVDIGAHRPLSK